MFTFSDFPPSSFSLSLCGLQIILQSMHKYKPRVHIIIQDSRFDLSQTPSLPAAGVQTFSFKETEFTTVTAYQNQQVKINLPGVQAGFCEQIGGKYDIHSSSSVVCLKNIHR